MTAKTSRTVAPCCPRLEPYWRLATNEDGWKCSTCGVDLGFRPDLDRSYAYFKVDAVLMELHEAKVVYVSNGTQGEIVCRRVARKAGIAGQYDQQTIARLLLSDPDLSGEKHGAFWQRESDKWLDGEPTSTELAAERTARLNAGQLELIA